MKGNANLHARNKGQNIYKLLHVMQTLKEFITYRQKLQKAMKAHKVFSSSNNPMHKQLVKLILRNANANEEHQVNQEYQGSEKSSAYFEKA